MAKFDIYEEITNRIIAQLEQGQIPWKKPWTGGIDGAVSYTTRRPYSLINQFLLGEPGEYITLKQVNALDGKVKKGSHSKMVVFWKVYSTEEKDKDGEPVKDENGDPVVRGHAVLRYYRVFHINDCEGIEPHDDNIQTAEELREPEEVFSDYIDREGIKLEQNCLSDKAYYSPVEDAIHLPLITQFENTAEYYSTMFHESVHSTGHSTRLDRKLLENAGFGSENYGKEELVAEIGSASILHALGIETPSSFRNSAAYIQSWLRALKNDKKMIVSAAGKAEKAMNYILGNRAEEIFSACE